MKSSPRYAWRGMAALGVGLLACLPTSATAVEPQLDFVFEALGAAACAMPPPSVDITQVRG